MISPISPLHLPYIFPTSPQHLPYISPTSPLHLPYISPGSRPSSALPSCASCGAAPACPYAPPPLTLTLILTLTLTLTLTLILLALTLALTLTLTLTPGQASAAEWGDMKLTIHTKHTAQPDRVHPVAHLTIALPLSLLLPQP